VEDLMPRGISKDLENFKEVLAKGVLLVGGEIVDNNSIDLEDDDPVSVAIVVNVQGYGPHVGAIAVTQGGHIDSALEAADEILEEWEMDHNPGYYAELEKEHGENARDVFTETFDGFMWELSAHEFADAIRGTKAVEFIEIDEPEEEEGVLEEGSGEEDDVPLIRTSFSRVTWGDSGDSDDYEEEHGWIDEEGVEFEPDESDVEDGMSESESIVAQAIKFLEDEGAAHASSSHFHPGIWYSTESEEDFQTGANEERSFHLDGFSKEEQAEIFKAITRRR
jgi:hypothetical protein